MNSIRDSIEAARRAAMAAYKGTALPISIDEMSERERFDQGNRDIAAYERAKQLDRIERLLNVQHQLLIAMMERMGLLDEPDSICRDSQEPDF